MSALHAITRLLEESGLPTDDLSEQDLSLFRTKSTGQNLYAVGGLERCGDTALLRSVATSAPMRGRGIASDIVDELEMLALNHGFDCLYLLTDSAERFFASKGYTPIERCDAPPAVRGSRQFSTICPDTATVMCKRLGS